MVILQGRVGVVTGGAGGIGRAIALELAKAGMDVALADLDEPGMNLVKDEIERLGRRCLCVVTDVTQRSSVDALLEKTLAELGSCHLMVNNAGVFYAGTMLGCSNEQWQRVIDVNLWGVINGCRAFGSHFAKQGEGHLVNTSSAAGLFPMPGMSSYSTSKAAVIAFGQQLRWELAAAGVGVTTLVPGVVKTRMASTKGVGLEHIDMDAVVSKSPPPEGLARKVVVAVRRNRPFVHYGPDSYLFAWMRHWPQWLLEPLGRYMARKSREVLTLPAAAPREISNT
jgi:NAD(P)-dependent dehydrogenase (short-subunit alcohol dehydrogenase family)